MSPVQVIHVKGQNSQELLSIEVEVVAALVTAYMTKIPNDQRDLKTALKVMRFHDGLTQLLIKEVEAITKMTERRTIKNLRESDV